MDPVDRQLLDALQEAVPLVPMPFAALGETLGLSEDEVLRRVRRLKEERIIRQIGPIFSSRRLGYQSTLVAFRVEPERLDEVAVVVSAHPGVSHNYSRNHYYNLWFTLTLPPQQDLEEAIARIAEESNVGDYLNLPSLRLFKLGVHFDLRDKRHPKERKERAKAERDPQGADEPVALTDFERDVVRVLQGHMPLVKRPFKEAADQLGVPEETLLETARDMDRRGVMRRFSAVLKHRRAGFTANGMVCWVVPEEWIVEAGQAAATFPAVSHCYQRPAYPPRWPYNLFTMVHGQSKEEVEAVVEQIRQLMSSTREIDPVEHTILYSQREFKKERVRYFVEE